MISLSGFVLTIYEDLGNSGEYIKFSVTVFFLPKKYPKLIEITFFFLNSKSLLHALTISQHHVSLAARNCSFRVDMPQGGNLIFGRNLVVRRGEELRGIK